MISTTYIAVMVNILSAVLPKMGLTIGNDALTTTIQTIMALGTGIWILIQRYKKGDVTMSGVRK